jgi:hypothetical protein
MSPRTYQGDIMATEAEITKFSLAIEELIDKKSIPYIDAVILHCQITGLEVELAAQLVSGAMKSHIRAEAEALHFLPKTKSKKLPIRG